MILNPFVIIVMWIAMHRQNLDMTQTTLVKRRENVLANVDQHNVLMLVEAIITPQLQD